MEKIKGSLEEVRLLGLLVPTLQGCARFDFLPRTISQWSQRFSMEEKHKDSNCSVLFIGLLCGKLIGILNEAITIFQKGVLDLNILIHFI